MPGIWNGDGISLDSTIAQHLAFEYGQLLRHHEAPAHGDNAPQCRSNSPQIRDPRSRINRSIESPHGNVLFGDSFGAADPSDHRCCVIVDGNRLGCRLLGGSRCSKHDLRSAGLGRGLGHGRALARVEPAAVGTSSVIVVLGIALRLLRCGRRGNLDAWYLRGFVIGRCLRLHATVVVDRPVTIIIGNDGLVGRIVILTGSSAFFS